MKTRPEGVRIKHRANANSIKMYDKQGSVLRVETTINDAADFKSFRTPEGKPEADKAWYPMCKGIADLHRRAETSQAANDRYLRALASVQDTTSLGELASRLCQPARRNGRRSRPLNPYAPDEAKLLDAISPGEFTINGFRNRDVRSRLFHDDGASKQHQRRHAAAVSRKLALLRAHRLITKVPGTHRYHLSDRGRIVVTAFRWGPRTAWHAKALEFAFIQFAPHQKNADCPTDVGFWMFCRTSHALFKGRSYIIPESLLAPHDRLADC